MQPVSALSKPLKHSSAKSLSSAPAATSANPFATSSVSAKHPSVTLSQKKKTRKQRADEMGWYSTWPTAVKEWHDDKQAELEDWKNDTDKEAEAHDKESERLRFADLDLARKYVMEYGDGSSDDEPEAERDIDFGTKESNATQQGYWDKVREMLKTEGLHKAQEEDHAKVEKLLQQPDAEGKVVEEVDSDADLYFNMQPGDVIVPIQAGMMRTAESHDALGASQGPLMSYSQDTVEPPSKLPFAETPNTNVMEHDNSQPTNKQDAAMPGSSGAVPTPDITKKHKGKMHQLGDSSSASHSLNPPTRTRLNSTTRVSTGSPLTSSSNTRARTMSSASRLSTLSQAEPSSEPRYQSDRAYATLASRHQGPLIAQSPSHSQSVSSVSSISRSTSGTMGPPTSASQSTNLAPRRITNTTQSAFSSSSLHAPHSDSQHPKISPLLPHFGQSYGAALFDDDAMVYDRAGQIGIGELATPRWNFPNTALPTWKSATDATPLSSSKMAQRRNVSGALTDDGTAPEPLSISHATQCATRSQRAALDTPYQPIGSRSTYAGSTQLRSDSMRPGDESIQSSRLQGGPARGTPRLAADGGQHGLTASSSRRERFASSGTPSQPASTAPSMPQGTPRMSQNSVSLRNKRASSASIGQSLLRGSVPLAYAEDYESRLNSREDAATDALHKLDGLGSTRRANHDGKSDPKSPRTSRVPSRPGSASRRTPASSSRASSPDLRSCRSSNYDTTAADKPSLRVVKPSQTSASTASANVAPSAPSNGTKGPSPAIATSAKDTGTSSISVPVQKTRASLSTASSVPRSTTTTTIVKTPASERLTEMSSSSTSTSIACRSPASSDTASSLASPRATPVLTDEEERVRDNEMEDYIRRQQARKLAAGASQAELDKMLEFPEAVAP
ncbi:uncharacterized protein UBRO2_05966 [Ustilago bromivora]|uniref:Uncharacterized protein n=1 Tax=Ustilago bromivora TaxID=307758 RepID=A0A8H8TVJ9_9BASI|nr:uncharacterized protein UBRO2_05966 [Ustilago bromivora]